jgi:hypothetical protein
VKGNKLLPLIIWLFLGSYRKSDIVFVFALEYALSLKYVNVLTGQTFERACLLSTYMGFASYSTLEDLTFELYLVSGGGLTFLAHPFFSERIVCGHVAQNVRLRPADAKSLHL